MSRALPDDLDCVVAVEQVTDYLEGAMPLQARARFEQHLCYCPACMTYLRQIKAQIAASAALAEPKPPPDEVTRTLLQLFRASRGG
jgi:predicted anti-sigma-YlaC factor YlaD